jgi:hypothetical protein
LEFELLSGAPQVNDKAVQELLANVDSFIERWIAKPEEIRKIRQLILEMRGIDIFEGASTVPDFLID